MNDPKIEMVKSSLAAIRPDLAREWHPTKNGELTPEKVTLGSGKKVWWICNVKAEHQWDAIIASRVYGRGCPYCSNQRVSGDKSLAKIHPNIAKEWHPTKNGNLTPYQVLPGSAKKVWWKCTKCGSDSNQPISSRSRRRGCPYCCKPARAVNYTNCLSTKYPALIMEWHPLKNDNLTSDQVLPGSNKKVWWSCKKCGSDFEQTPNNRTKGSGCPYCSTPARAINHTNCLSTTHPELVKEWHPQKNSPKTSEHVTAGSSFRAWWSCKKCRSDFRQQIFSRTKGSGCPYCSTPAKAINHTNCLSTTHPELVKEWHPQKNYNLTPNKILRGSDKIVWWICQNCSYEWSARIANRAIHDQKCPRCAGRYTGPESSLGTKYPELAREWHPIKNERLTPFELSPGSNLSVWWLCKVGHEFKNSIQNRVSRSASCPTCRGMVSKAQARLYFELKTLIPTLLMRHYIKNLEADIAFVERKLVIEYDGSYWHRNKDESDKKKSKKFEKLGYQVLRLREPPLLKLNSQDILLSSEAPIKKCDIDKCVRWLGAKSFISKNQSVSYMALKGFAADKSYNEFLAGLPSPLYENSLESKFPEVANQFHPIKNNPLTARDFLPASNKKIWWLCVNGCEWEDTISHRTGRRSGCPYCGPSNKRPGPLNNLEAKFPAVAKEWHNERNAPILPNKVLPGNSRIKFWWLCPEGHEYQALVSNRTRGRNCPICSNKKVTEENCLKTTNPKLSSEWEYDKNHPLTPYHVTAGSNKRVWWKCKDCSHTWQTTVASRNNGATCKPCSHLRKNDKNKFVVNGVGYSSHKDLAVAYGLNRRLVSRRLFDGWTLEEAVGLSLREK